MEEVKIKVFEMFAGVGGFSQAFPKDWGLVGVSEIDKYASMVLKYHYPNVKNYGDCKTINWNEVPDFDLLTGGSPCQDFSIAGKRAGIMGSRSGLVWEYIRCLNEKKPRYFIWENVKGLLSSRKGFDFASILTAFSESGYALWWQVLNAKDFGVPQNRERIFVFGSRVGSPPKVFFESKDSGQIEIVGTTLGEENTRIGERDFVYGVGGIMGGLKATDYKQPPQILVQNKGESQHYRLYDTDGLAPTLQSQSGMSSQKHPFIIQKTQYGKHQQDAFVEKEGIIGAIPAGTHASTPHLLKTRDLNNKIRKLMPIECERLMSWKDNWTKYGINEKGEKVEMSDSQRYRQCGNGVVSNVVKVLIDNLIVPTL